jgi:hypothetical protein
MEIDRLVGGGQVVQGTKRKLLPKVNRIEIGNRNPGIVRCLRSERTARSYFSFLTSFAFFVPFFLGIYISSLVGVRILAPSSMNMRGEQRRERLKLIMRERTFSSPVMRTVLIYVSLGVRHCDRSLQVLAVPSCGRGSRAALHSECAFGKRA